MGIAMQHMNENILCSIDVETTGLNPLIHEIIEIAIIPMDSALDIRTDILPFHLQLRPTRPETIDHEALTVNKMDLATLNRVGIDPDMGIALLDEWIGTKLNLRYTKWDTPKQILPLGHNVGFDVNFIRAWVGQRSYDSWFHYRTRCTAATANYMNDRFASFGYPVPFNKIGLEWLCNKMEVQNNAPHTAMGDAVATAKLYKKMSLMFIPSLPPVVSKG